MVKLGKTLLESVSTSGFGGNTITEIFNKKENLKSDLEISNESFFGSFVWFFYLFLTISTAILIPAIYVNGQKMAFADFLFLPVFGLWLLGVILGKFRFRNHRFYWLLLFYFAAMCFSTAFSDNFRQSLIKLCGEAYLLSLAVLTFNLACAQRKINQLIFAWLLGTLVTVLIAVAALFFFYCYPDHWFLKHTTSIYGAVPVGNYPRLKSTFVSASMFCNYLSVSLVLVLIAKQTGQLGNKLYFVSIISILICAFLTFSSGLGGIILILGIWYWAIFKRSKKDLSRVMLAGSIAVLVPFSIMNLFALQPYSTAPYSITLPFINQIVMPSPRVVVWTESFDTFINNIFFGKGLGLGVCEVLFQNTDGHFSLLTDAHNIFLSVAAQTGIFGLVGITSITVYLTRHFQIIRTMENSSETLTAGLSLAFLSAFVFQGFTGSFEDTRHIWILIGMLLASEVLLKNRKRTTNL